MIIFKKYRLALLSILFFIVSWYIHYETRNEPNLKKIARSLEQSIAFKNRVVQQAVDTLVECALNNTITEYVADNYETLDSYSKNEGIVFYVYRDNKLVYWTDNSLSIPENNEWWKKRFFALGNSQVVIYNNEKQNCTAIGVIVVKNNYSIENEYLLNEMHPSFSVRNGINITPANSKAGIPVCTTQNEELFRVCCAKERIVSKNVTLIVFLLFLAGVVTFLLFVKERFSSFLTGVRGVFVMLIILVLIVYALYTLRVPAFLLDIPLFNSEYFKISELNISFGNLLLLVLISVFTIFIYYSSLKYKIQNGKLRANYPLFILMLIIAILFGILGLNIFHKLIHESSFQFEAYNLVNLSVYSFVGYTILILLYGGFLLLIDISLYYISIKADIVRTVIISNLILVLFSVLFFILVGNINKMALSFLIILLNYLLYLRFKGSMNPGEVVLIVFLFTVFSTLYLRQQNFIKQKVELEKLAEKMVQEQDAVANTLIEELIPEIKTDSIIKKMLTDNEFDYGNLVRYTRANYFSGYLSSYDFQLTVCDRYDSLLIDEMRNEWFHCYRFFNWIISHEGEPTSVEGLYYLSDQMGTKNLFLKLPVTLGEGWNNVTLFIELLTKPNYEALGYPGLLLQTPLVDSEKRNITYARYNGNKLVASSGDFAYAFDLSVYNKTGDKIRFFQSDDYDHLLYTSVNDVSIIISYPSIGFYDILVSFTYIFIFFLMLMFSMLWITNNYLPVIDFQLTVKNRMVLAMIVILMLSLVLMGIATAFYTAKQFDDRQFSIMSEKTQSVLVELENKLSGVKNINDVDINFLTKNLVEFSNVFYSDINMYNLQGELIATSRKQIFDKNLISRKMNAVAFRELVLNKKAKLVQKENIGSLDYYSAYVPFLGVDNKPIAYLNLPYFAKEKMLQSEMVMVVVAVINVYAFLILISVLIAIYVSDRFTAPLQTLQARLKEIKLGGENQHIDYEGSDEVAELVAEYNRMLGELQKSAVLLAKSERESAWREMARQIAHEIKNPLTPMKLNVQLLERSLKNNDPDFLERFEKTSGNLIEQIDALSSIATTFSQFARTPLTKLEKVNIIERIRQAIELFKNHENVDITIDNEENEKLYINADNEKVLQVFNNLIKNAVHAVACRENGEIHISYTIESNTVIVKISDNGIGIENNAKDKLFQPYFTTKTSGTGLGLAIVKTIMDDLDGDIWFESELNKGADFFVKFKLYDI